MKRKFLIRALSLAVALTSACTMSSCYVSGFGGSSSSSSIEGESHDWQSVYSYNSTYHWYQCNDCEYGKDIAEHTLDENFVCTVCGYVKSTDGLMYQVSEDGTYAEVTAFWRTDATVCISDTYKGVPVTKIGDSAFADKTMSSVIIPEGVTTIGKSAFSGCNNLTSVTFPNSLTTIEDSAFMECDKLANVTLGDNVTYIGNSAFQECGSLVNINIPSDITFVSPTAFDYCRSLSFETYENAKYLGNENNPYVVLSGVTDTNAESYTIHENTKFIFDGAFENCVNLTSASIPNGVTSLGNSVFSGCTSLTSVNIPGSVTSIGNNTFSGCTALTSVSIPDGVTAIGNNAFADCTNLTNVSIPDGVTSVSTSAFSNCTNLTYTTYENVSYLGNASNPYVVLTKVTDTTAESYTIPEKTKIIFDNAFENCKYVKSMVVPDSVISIGASAFYKCSKMTSITIGKGVISIGSNAVRSCTKLTNINVSAQNTAYQSINGNLYTKDGKTLLQYALGKTDASFVVPEGVTHINTAAVAACQMTSVTLPSTITYIGVNGFNNCKNLTSINIPLSVTTIGYNAFKSCANLTIYCEATSQPNGWTAWNPSDCPVVWGHKA